MRSAGSWSAIMIMVSFGACGVTVINAYPRYLKTVPDAMAWDVLVSTVFLVGRLPRACSLPGDAHSPHPLCCPQVLTAIGLNWAFLYLAVLGRQREWRGGQSPCSGASTQGPAIIHEAR